MTNPLLKGLKPTHPGELLREDVLPAVGGNKVAFARALGVSRQTVYDLLNEKQPVTPSMALRLAKVTRTTPDSWLRMQIAYDLKTLEPQMAPVLAALPELVAA